MPGKVLIADRSPKVQKELAQLLQEAGIDSASVNNGEFAVRSLAKEKPHLVLADVFMLVRNGYEVCAHIKGDSETAHIPVLLLVGSDEPYDQERAVMVGAADKLEKPFTDPQAVLSTIKQHLGTVLPQAPPAVRASPPPPPAATAASTTAAAAPAEPVVDEEPVTEQELFFMGPEPAQMEPQESPLGFAELLGDEITAAVAAAPAATGVDIKSFFLKQKQAVRGRTSEVMARIKPEHMGWRPEKEALSVGEMLRHIWMSEQGLRRTALKGDFSYYEKRLPQGLRAVLGQPASLEEELKNLDTVHKQTLAQVQAFPVERWQEERAHPGLGIRRKVYAFLFGINEHEIHHRAQLMLYLRLLGSPLPEPTVRRKK